MKSENVKVGLSMKHWRESGEYIFPMNVKDIPGCNKFGDFDVIYEYALQKMYKYENKEIDLYICAGLSSELLEVIKVANKLNITCNIYYYDKESNGYLCHDRLTWKPQVRKNNAPVVEFAACANRHWGLEDIACIFETIENDKLFDVVWLREYAREKLEKYSGYHMDLFITGLTQAYVTILNVAAELGITVTALIYDTSIEDYLELNMD